MPWHRPCGHHPRPCPPLAPCSSPRARPLHTLPAAWQSPLLQEKGVPRDWPPAGGSGTWAPRRNPHPGSRPAGGSTEQGREGLSRDGTLFCLGDDQEGSARLRRGPWCRSESLEKGLSKLGSSGPCGLSLGQVSCPLCNGRWQVPPSASRGAATYLRLSAQKPLTCIVRWFVSSPYSFGFHLPAQAVRLNSFCLGVGC